MGGSAQWKALARRRNEVSQQGYRRSYGGHPGSAVRIQVN